VTQVVIINTGTANLASVRAAFTRLGVESVVAEHRSQIERAPRLVLPGVGSFGSGMSRLREMDAVKAVVDYVASDRPFLAVCLGLQLLCRSSEESPGVEGLSILDVDVQKFRTQETVPQLGWNRVEPDTATLIEDGYAYYANSFRLGDVPTGWHAAYTTHGERFVAAVERNGALACQFHPELSGAWGRQLLSRWLEREASC
jgi:imidazole glycerol phosphate synthase glutamine amidotransferase subunit